MFLDREWRFTREERKKKNLDILSNEKKGLRRGQPRSIHRLHTITSPAPTPLGHCSHCCWVSLFASFIDVTTIQYILYICTIASLRCIHDICYPRLPSLEVCGQTCPSPSARDIFDHKLPLTSVSGSMYSEYTWRLWYTYYIYGTTITRSMPSMQALWTWCEILHCALSCLGHGLYICCSNFANCKFTLVHNFLSVKKLP